MNARIQSIERALVVVFVISLGIATPAFCRQIDEKVLSRQSARKVQEAVGKLAADGYVPVDAEVDCNGRRAMFNVRMTKPIEEIHWYSGFQLSDAEFEKLFEDKRQEGFRVAWHQEYEIKKHTLHACIWHSDGSFQPLTNEQLFDSNSKPEPTPLGIVWKPAAQVPVDSAGHEAFAKLEERSAAFVKANQMPALSVAVSFDGKEAYEGAFGYRDHERKSAIRLGQPIRLGVLSQLITSVAVLQLADRGQLRLDEPVYPLLGLEPWKKTSVDARSKQITVLHLLQETSGHDRSKVIEPGFQPQYLSSVFKQKGKLVTPDRAISFMMSQPLSHTPGEKSLESSYSYFLLGRVIEKVSGQSYEDYVLGNIALPLSMTSLTMSRTNPDKRTKHEVRNVYRPGTWHQQLAGSDRGKWVQIDDGGYHFELLDASDAWMATAGDVLRLTSAIQANPSRMLSEEAKAILIAKPDYAIAKEKIDRKPVVSWKGCSVFCQQTPGGITFFRHGMGANTSAGVVCDSSSGVSFCYVFNCSATATGKHPKGGYHPILREEAYRVRKLPVGN
jgi:CubicO group peptidase (beta-lactamase class C family)